MEAYGKILLIAMPAFLFLVLFEKWYGWKKGNDTVRTMDMISSMSSGITNVTKDVAGLSFVILSYPFFVRHLAITTVQSSVLVYIIAFLSLDFAGYWVHRLQHVTNFFWNGHIIHHSSEEFNLACALRQSISSVVKTFAIFLLPAALLGVPATVIAVIAPLHLFAQFWYHTRHIGKMGFLEKIIVTPSHHRVHHAINPEYIDKNYGQIFIIWDRIFDTYQPELKEVPPVYGITRPAQTWNPVKINFQHISLLIRDAWYTGHWTDKFRIWFMPTGWRPADVMHRFPVLKIEDVYQFEKYDPKTSPALRAWCWFQVIVMLLFISYLFGNIAVVNHINTQAIYIYCAFVFLSVYAYSELMDRSRYAVIWEILRIFFGIAILYRQGDWFGASRIISGTIPVLLLYFTLSLIVTAWFNYQHRKEDVITVTPA